MNFPGFAADIRREFSERIVGPISVRPGAGGGFYVARPGLSGAAEALILYLVLSPRSLRALRDAPIIVCQLAVRSLIGRAGVDVYRGAPRLLTWSP